MNHSPSATSPLRYGRKLFHAGITGICTGQDFARREESLSSLAAEAARGSLAPAAVGACVGLLRSCLSSRRNRLPKVLALGLAGSALGFSVGFAWRTRKITVSVVNSAALELSKVRDEHWLELNPIDYA